MRKTHKWLGLAIATVLIMGIVAIPAMSEEAPTFGTIPDEAWDTVDGSVDRSLVPDYVAALDRSGDFAGYVSADDILPTDGTPAPDGPIPVVDGNLALVGHMVPDRGFVPLGTLFEDVPRFPVRLIHGLEDGTEEIVELHKDQ